MAAAKAADAVYKVTPPRAGRMLRELLYNAFYVTDHATHFYVLSGPDLIVGPDAPTAERNILGVVKKVGAEVGRKVIDARGAGHRVIEIIGGRRIHPCTGVPGGMTKAISEEERAGDRGARRGHGRLRRLQPRALRPDGRRGRLGRRAREDGPLPPRDVLRGPRRRGRSRHVLRRAGQGRGPRRLDAGHLCPRRVPRLDRGEGGALDVPEVPLPEVRWAGRASSTARIRASTRWHHWVASTWRRAWPRLAPRRPTNAIARPSPPAADRCTSAAPRTGPASSR